MSTSHVEIERKYEAPAEAVPDLSKLKHLTAGEPEVHRMEATYFDTADGALAASRVVLRRRRGGTDEGWHVKFVLDGERHEVQFPLLKDAHSMPAAVRDLVSAVSRRAELEPIADLNTQRTRTPLLDSEDVEIAEWCDDQVHSTDRRAGRDGQERSWREWEIELKREDLSEKQQKKVFKNAEKVLLAAGGSPSASPAKIARVLGQDREFDDAHGIEPATPRAAAEEPPRLTGAQSLVSELVGSVLADIVVLDMAVRCDVEDSVHQLRIRLRTMRSILRSLRGALDEEFYELVAQGAKSAGEALSAARDLEVVEQVLRECQAWPDLTEHAREEILDLLHEDQKSALRTGHAFLDSKKYRKMLNRLADLARDPQLSGWAAEVSAKKLGAQMMETLDERYRKRIEPARQAARTGEETEAAVESLHEVRKAAKSLRYVIESLEDADLIRKKQREDAGEARKEATGVQSEVGRLLDLRVSVQWLEHAGRVFQRRAIDRFGVGLVLGHLRTVLAEKLAEGFSSLLAR